MDETRKAKLLKLKKRALQAREQNSKEKDLQANASNQDAEGSLHETSVLQQASQEESLLVSQSAGSTVFGVNNQEGWEFHSQSPPPRPKGFGARGSPSPRRGGHSPFRPPPPRGFSPHHHQSNRHSGGGPGNFQQMPPPVTPEGQGPMAYTPGTGGSNRMSISPHAYSPYTPGPTNPHQHQGGCSPYTPPGRAGRGRGQSPYNTPNRGRGRRQSFGSPHQGRGGQVHYNSSDSQKRPRYSQGKNQGFYKPSFVEDPWAPLKKNLADVESH